jgi:hypothetical protein
MAPRHDQATSDALDARLLRGKARTTNKRANGSGTTIGLMPAANPKSTAKNAIGQAVRRRTARKRDAVPINKNIASV